jgi:hypothetical protein
MDEDEDQDPEAGSLVVIEWFDDGAAAHGAAAALVEHGIGAVLDDGSPPRTGLAVLPSEAPRARELLGLAEPEAPTGEVDLRTASRSWLVPVLIFAVALVLVPLIAFFVSFKLAGG